MRRMCSQLLLSPRYIRVCFILTNQTLGNEKLRYTFYTFLNILYTFCTFLAHWCCTFGAHLHISCTYFAHFLHICCCTFCTILAHLHISCTLISLSQRFIICWHKVACYNFYGLLLVLKSSFVDWLFTCLGLTNKYNIEENWKRNFEIHPCLW